MPKKRYRPEEIVAKLRQVDVLVSQGQNIADAMSVLRNLAIDRRRPRSWLRSAGAGTSATIAAARPGEADIIVPPTLPTTVR